MTIPRPHPVTAICVVWVLATLFDIYVFTRQPLSAYDDWFVFYFAGQIGGGLAAVAGIWMMRKWGVILFTFLFAANQVVLFGLDAWSLDSVLVPVLVMVVGYAHLARME